MPVRTTFLCKFFAQSLAGSRLQVHGSPGVREIPSLVAKNAQSSHSLDNYFLSTSEGRERKRRNRSGDGAL